jgi:hypothetical protein
MLDAELKIWIFILFEIIVKQQISRILICLKKTYKSYALPFKKANFSLIK